MKSDFKTRLLLACRCVPTERVWITTWPPAVAEDQFLRRSWESTR